MPVRALRLPIRGLACFPLTLLRGKRTNARQGIEAEFHALDLAAAQRRGKRTNARQGIEAMLRSLTEPRKNKWKKNECPSGH